MGLMGAAGPLDCHEDSRDEDWYPLTLTSLLVGPGRFAA